MARSEVENIIRELAKSSSISFGTTAPFAIEGISVRRIGFASIPVVELGLHCKCQDFSAMVPIARQIVFRYLERNGLESEILMYTPTVSAGSTEKIFVDRNPNSPTNGSRKRGLHYSIHFEIKKLHVDHFDWLTFRNGAINSGPVKIGIYADDELLEVTTEAQKETAIQEWRKLGYDPSTRPIK